jgi:hypothetical protein
MTQDSTGNKPAGINWGAVAPGIAFVVIVAIGAAVFANMRATEQRILKEVAAEVQQLGLPEGYPLQDIPLYGDLQISEQSRGETQSTEGKPMDEWIIKATSGDDKQQIFDWYKDKLIARGMGQTQFISIPTGLAVTYGDEQYSVELEIEKLETDKLTRVTKRVYKLQD